MLNRCVSIAIAVCILTALPIILFHSLDDSTVSTEQSQQIVAESSTDAVPATHESSRLNQVSGLLYGVYTIACLLIISLLIHYGRAYKMAVLKSKWMAYSSPEATL